MSLLGLAFLLFALFLLASTFEPGKSNQGSGPSETFLSYQSLSKETHTGLRFVRLDDFVAQHGDSSYTLAVQAWRNALKRHEEIDWARLTSTFYDAEADEISKSTAIKAYTDIWTLLHRREQLKTLRLTLPNDAVPNFKPGE